MERFYVGHKHSTMTVFKHNDTPTTESHGQRFNAVTGPFKTKRGATWFSKYSSGNPHCYNVAQAEKLAVKYPD